MKQAGSLVAPDRLRFDFSHYSPVTSEQVREIEDLVNDRILADEPVAVGQEIALRNAKNDLIAVMTVEETFEWDLQREAQSVYAAAES